MNSERTLTLIYLVLGIIAGVLSSRMNAGLAIFLALVIYGVSFTLVKNIVKEEKKFTWYLMNTGITFVLVWLVVWILLFNLGV